MQEVHQTNVAGLLSPESEEWCDAAQKQVELDGHARGNRPDHDIVDWDRYVQLRNAQLAGVLIKFGRWRSINDGLKWHRPGIWL